MLLVSNRRRLGSMWEDAEKQALDGLPLEKDVKFFVDGECVGQSLVLEVAEESNYMADYVIGKEGKIKEIRYDRID